MNLRGILLILACMAVSLGSHAADEPFLPKTLFASNTDGYHTFRIPSLLRTSKGTLLAFAEGRRGGTGDSGDIDLVMKRSDDNGSTWSAMTVIADEGANTIGNPCPVEDTRTGVIHMLLTWNHGEDKEHQIMMGTSRASRDVYIMRSSDDGKTWSALENITASTKRPEWTWYATGPGIGIQTRDGRLIVPCDFAMTGTKAYGSHVILSDDGGATWKIGGVINDRVNECQVAELSDGRLMLNMRSYHKLNRRAVATSSDGGLTWSDLSHDDALVEPVCQAAFISIPTAEGKRRLVFSNPASTKRELMTVRWSDDDGKTWQFASVNYEGQAAYSSLAALNENEVGLLSEWGEKSPYEMIKFERFPLGVSLFPRP